MSSRPMRNTDLPARKERACVHCGITFQPDTPARILCSDACAIARRAAWQPKHMATYRAVRTPLPDAERERLIARVRDAYADGCRGAELRSRFGKQTDHLLRLALGKAGGAK